MKWAKIMETALREKFITKCTRSYRQRVDGMQKSNTTSFPVIPTMTFQFNLTKFLACIETLFLHSF